MKDKDEMNKIKTKVEGNKNIKTVKVNDNAYHEELELTGKFNKKYLKLLKQGPHKIGDYIGCNETFVQFCMPFSNSTNK